MSINNLLNTMRLQASLVSGNQAQTKLGTISSFDSANYLATVLLLEGDNDVKPLLTGWLPVGTQWIGNGWGMFSPPSPGDLVEVHFQEGSLQNGYVNQRFFTSSEAPLNVPVGEFWLVHKDGAFIKLLNDGKLSFSSGNEIDAVSPLVKLGILADVKKLVTEALIDAFNEHVHTIPDGFTGIPTVLLDDAVLTVNTKAS